MRFGGLIAAIVFAALAAVLVLRMSGDKPAPAQTAQAPAQQLKTVDIYVAAVPIQVGSVITPEMLAVQPWPEHLILEGFVRAAAAKTGGVAGIGGNDNNDADIVVGNVARSSFQQQEPIIKTKLSNPNDPNFLAGALPKGMRIVTMVVNEVEGVAGFVFPGDHVDVLLTHAVEKIGVRLDPVKREPKEDKRTETYTETLLNNVVVVAVDQRPSNVGTTDKDGKLIVPKTVSLMVSPADAQKVRLGQKIGTLTLSLRSLADKDSVDPAIFSGPKDVSQVSPKDDSSTDSGVIIYRGAESSVDENASRSANAVNFLKALTSGTSNNAGSANPVVNPQNVNPLN